MSGLVIEVTDAAGRHMGSSPVTAVAPVHAADCDCPKKDFDDWFDGYGCRGRVAQIEDDLAPFSEVGSVKYTRLAIRITDMLHGCILRSI